MKPHFASSQKQLVSARPHVVALLNRLNYKRLLTVRCISQRAACLAGTHLWLSTFRKEERS